uniref:AAA+ ATPase domain-containing protein n=1 Tax=Rhizochromulina marina TaxID=1034831 RepID=A0A7S2S4Z9_9STRA|mmetsp:Transcript_25164/g.73522  ORF Transcript_25164/g.73522 Transcript_25164/m.73522 type:complete len:933 (+) Transcript_25164:196-2994(+)
MMEAGMSLEEARSAMMGSSTGVAGEPTLADGPAERHAALPEGGEEGGHNAASDAPPFKGGDIGASTTGLEPYSTDLEYLEDAFALILHRLHRYTTTLSDDSETYGLNLRQKRPEAILRELDAKERQARHRWERRLRATMEEGPGHFLPRMEQLSEQMGLDMFEKMVILTLVGAVISQEIRKASRGGAGGGGIGLHGMDVGVLLGTHCSTLEEQIHARKYFYRNSAMIRTNIIRLSDRSYGGSDLLDAIPEIDRRMLDYIAGLSTELQELVDGGTCYSPSVKLDQVVLPQRTKDLLLETVENVGQVRQLEQEFGLDKVVTYGRGLILLFHGEPGTGKTFTANALANHLGKKVILINLPAVQSDFSSEVYRFLFREARIQNAVLFFDECEKLFESREQNSRSPVSVALTEVEHFEGMLILATNRPQQLDEALFRRLTLTIPFQPPDHHMRAQIWQRHIPPRLPLDEGVDWDQIALEFELNGGYIRNAVLQALAFAVARARRQGKLGDGVLPSVPLCGGWGIVPSEAGASLRPPPGPLPSFEELGVLVREEDIRRACRLQAGSGVGPDANALLAQAQRNVPDQDAGEASPAASSSSSSPIDQLGMAPDLLHTLKGIATFEKARQVLSNQWGFGEGLHAMPASVLLIHGPHGCGHDEIVHALSSEIGCDTRVVRADELLRMRAAATSRAGRLHPRLASTGTPASSTAASVFTTARNGGQMVVVHGAEGLISAAAAHDLHAAALDQAMRSDGHAASTAAEDAFGLVGNADLYANLRSTLDHVRQFRGVVVLLATTTTATAGPQAGSASSSNRGGPSLPSLVARVVNHVVSLRTPSAEEREAMWRRFLPASAPVAHDVDWKRLADAFEDFLADAIRRALVNAASTAALRRDPDRRVITMEDLEDAAQREKERRASLFGFGGETGAAWGTTSSSMGMYM